MGARLSQTSRWSAEHPIDLEYLVVPRDSTAWCESWHSLLVQQDLGFSAASHGAIEAHRIRACGDGQSTGEAPCWLAPAGGFSWLFVLGGRLEVDSDRGVHLLLTKHDAVYMQAGWQPTEYWFSSDFEALKVDAQSALDEKARELPAPVVSMNGPHTYRTNGGAQRSYFDYRMFGLADLTNGLLEINITRSMGVPPPGGTGLHSHTMAQWNFTLDGWYDITIEGEESRRLRSGDSTFTPTGIRHQVTDYSRDLANLNLTIPARYETAEI